MDNKEVLEYVQTTSSIMEAQKLKIEGLEKKASELEAQVVESAKKAAMLEKKASETAAAKAPGAPKATKPVEKQATESPSRWGEPVKAAGEKRPLEKLANADKLRPSEQKLYERFGVKS
jgi:hypothetical protein